MGCIEQAGPLLVVSRDSALPEDYRHHKNCHRGRVSQAVGKPASRAVLSTEMARGKAQVRTRDLQSAPHPEKLRVQDSPMV